MNRLSLKLRANIKAYTTEIQTITTQVS